MPGRTKEQHKASSRRHARQRARCELSPYEKLRQPNAGTQRPPPLPRGVLGGGSWHLKPLCRISGRAKVREPIYWHLQSCSPWMAWIPSNGLGTTKIWLAAQPGLRWRTGKLGLILLSNPCRKASAWKHSPKYNQQQTLHPPKP